VAPYYSIGSHYFIPIKMRIILTILLFLFIKVEAQQSVTFSTIIKSAEDDYPMDIIETDNQEVLLLVRNGLNYYPRADFAEVYHLNRNGTIENSAKVMLPDTNILLTDIYLEDEYAFKAVGAEYSTNDNINYTRLVIYDFELDLTYSRSNSYKIDSSYDLIVLRTYQEANGDLLLSGALDKRLGVNQGNHSLAAVVFHNSDSIIFKARPKHHISTNIKQLPDKKYWFIEEGLGYYCLLDSNLTIIDSARLPITVTGNYSVRWDTDTSFYLLCKQMSTDPLFNLTLIRYIHPVDTSGSFYNTYHISDTVDFPSAYTGIDFRNTDSIFAGGTRNLDIYNVYHSNQPSWLMLFQTDSLLNLRWERFYGGDAYYVMQKLIATRDGGCLVAGTRFDYQNNENKTDIIVLKLNSEGLLVGQNELQESLLREAIVYPNPGSEAIQIRLAVQHPEALLELFDSQGKLVLSQQLHEKESLINTAQLPPGTYIYRLSAATGLNESGKWVKQ